MSSSEIDSLVQLLAKLPGLGPRSARRAALHLIKRKDTLLGPLAAALAQAASSVPLVVSAAIWIRRILAESALTTVATAP